MLKHHWILHNNNSWMWISNILEKNRISTLICTSKYAKFDLWNKHQVITSLQVTVTLWGPAREAPSWEGHAGIWWRHVWIAGPVDSQSAFQAIQHLQAVAPFLAMCWKNVWPQVLKTVCENKSLSRTSVHSGIDSLPLIQHLPVQVVHGCLVKWTAFWDSLSISETIPTDMSQMSRHFQIQNANTCHWCILILHMQVTSKNKQLQ